jgi:hypothetical protein
MWQWLLSVLASLAADPSQIDREAPRASAAVSAAYATTAQEKAPQPAPEPPKPACCTDCGGRGYITHGDGHRTACPCPATCRCKNPPGASLTPDAPTTPVGKR